MVISDFPIEVVIELVELDLQVVSDSSDDDYSVNCDSIACGECPLNHYTSTHFQCVAAVNHIRNHQLQSLLQSNPEIFI